MSLLLQTSKLMLRRASCANAAPSSHTPIRRSRHTVAIAREIPNSFLHAVVAHHSSSDQDDDAGVVSLTLARSQHHDYLSQLRKHVPTLCLPPLESHPDCLFVEDTIVAIGDTAVITRLGHESRRGEVDSIKDSVRQLGIANVYDMRESTGGDDDGEILPMCDGGDVMYTGRHLFVGQSDRTNHLGYQFLKDAFANNEGSGILRADDIISVPPVVAGKEVLHLKSAVTHIDECTVLAPEGIVGDVVLDAMKARERGYDAIRLPDVLSCNAVVVSGHVLAQDAPCDVSKERIEIACRERKLGLTFVDSSELAKKDGALTCCSVLLSV